MRVLTWNLAMLEPSVEAPAGWDLEATEAAVRERILQLDPDIVCFQELPGLVPYVETHDMVKANPRSHSGHLATLVRHELAGGTTAVGVAGCAILLTFPDRSLTVGNLHLAPGRGAAGERLRQLASVVEASPTPALFLIGDTNTRKAELAAIAAAGLRADDPPRPTWDSRRNRFRADAPEYTAYFTRWFASADVTVTDVAVHTEPHRLHGTHFHLSDHYALSATVGLRDASTAPPARDEPPATAD